jgi:tripartite-type tricarboxylate transporter receptor subunit TctC
MLTRRAALAGLVALPSVRAAAEQLPFPAKPLTLIVPFPGGGPADVVVVENKSGGAGVTGMDYVAKAGSDAHIMGLISASDGAIAQSLLPNMPYKPESDLAADILVVRVQEVLVVDARLGITDFKTLLARLKAEPGKFSYGSAGGITHLAAELFKHATGTDMVHVPYRGAALAADGLTAGQVQVAILDLPVVLPHIRSGALKAIAITSDSRAALLPGVPTMLELGYPRVQSDNWYGLVSPSQSRRADRVRLHGAAATALKAKDLIDAYAAVGGIVGGDSSEAFDRFRRKEVEKWAEVIRRANIRVD